MVRYWSTMCKFYTGFLFKYGFGFEIFAQISCLVDLENIFLDLLVNQNPSAASK